MHSYPHRVRVPLHAIRILLKFHIITCFQEQIYENGYWREVCECLWKLLHSVCRFHNFIFVFVSFLDFSCFFFISSSFCNAFIQMNIFKYEME